MPSNGDPLETLRALGRDRRVIASWARDSACREHPELDWYTGGTPTYAHRVVCTACLVREECLTFALSAGPYLTGVWGGFGRAERRRLRWTVRRSAS